MVERHVTLVRQFQVRVDRFLELGPNRSCEGGGATKVVKELGRDRGGARGGCGNVNRGDGQRKT